MRKLGMPKALIGESVKSRQLLLFSLENRAITVAINRVGRAVGGRQK